LSYLNNYNIFNLALTSKNINELIKKNIKLEIEKYDINSAYNIIKAYSNFKLHLYICENIENNEKFNFIKNNIITLSSHFKLPIIVDIQNLENLHIDVHQTNKY
jgi:hypothetical protein